MTLEQLLTERGIRGLKAGEHHHTRQGWIQYDCPFCGKGNHRYHLGLALKSNTFVCYRCGTLDRASTVSELLGIGLGEAIAELKGVTRPQNGRIQPFLGHKRGKLSLPYGLAPLNRWHRLYLEKRGFDPDLLVKTWGIAGLGFAPPLSHRIFIPISLHGEVVSWTTRNIKQKGLRYVSARADQEIYPHKGLLYGEDLCDQAIVVCEGPISAWAIGPGAVATCGLGFTKPQLLRMAKYPLRVVCFDSDPAAQRRAYKLCASLSAFGGRTINVQLDAKDPAEASKKEIKSIRNIIT